MNFSSIINLKPYETNIEFKVKIGQKDLSGKLFIKGKLTNSEAAYICNNLAVKLVNIDKIPGQQMELPFND